MGHLGLPAESLGGSFALLHPAVVTGAAHKWALNGGNEEGRGINWVGIYAGKKTRRTEDKAPTY